MGEYICLGIIAVIVIAAGWAFSPWGEDWINREQTKKLDASWEAEQRRHRAERQSRDGGESHG
jgi:hypothetical protein